jgi:hypothetical protein
MTVIELWSYDKQARRDKKGARWHFVTRDIVDRRSPFEEQAVEVYFRNDARTEYGVLRFPRRRENPYRNYTTMINKIMNDAEFRRALLDPGTTSVWRKGWK